MTYIIPQKTITQKVFSLIFICGQCFGTIPLEFVDFSENSVIRFRWASYKTIYTLFHITLLILMMFCCFYTANISSTGFNYRHAGK